MLYGGPARAPQLVGGCAWLWSHDITHMCFQVLSILLDMATGEYKQWLGIPGWLGGKGTGQGCLSVRFKTKALRIPHHVP